MADIHKILSNSGPYVAKDGSLGIGVAEPSKKLEVVSNTTYDGVQILGSSIPTLGIIDTTNNAKFVAYVRDSDATIGMETNHPLTINTNNTERMRITSDGLVGIGTTSPTSVFEVYGGSTGTNDIDRYVRFKASNGEKRFDFHIGGTGNASVLDMYSNDGTTQGVQIASAGTTYFNGGSVGIGTTSPSNKLHVYGGSSQDVIARFEATGTGTSDYSEIHIANNNNDRLILGSIGSNYTNSSWAGMRYVYSTVGDLGLKAIASNGNVRIYAGGSAAEKMRITSSGNIGIGNTSPSSKLHVTGDTYISGQLGQGVATANKLVNYGAEFRTSGASAQIFFGRDGNDIGTGGIGADSTYVLSVWKSDFSRPFIVKQTGEVGIGTTSPSQMLHLEKADNPMILISRDSSNRVLLGDTGSNNGGDLLLYNSSGSNTARIRAGSVSYLNGGNVGIGTTSPSHLVSIGTTGNASGKKLTFYLGGSNGNYAGIGAQRGETNVYCSSEIRFINENESSGKGAMSFNTGLNTLNERMRIDSSGNVGIGTTSPNGTRMLISGSDTSPEFNTTGISDTTLVLSNSDVAYGTVFGTFGSGSGVIQQRRITSAVYYDLLLQPYAGNVGIGTTSPSYKLSVSDDTDGSVNIFQLRNGDATYSQSFSYVLDTSKNLVITGASGAGGVRYNVGTNGFTIAGGNVGIGTTSPNSYYANANNLVVGSHTGSNGISILSATDQTGWLVFADSTSSGDNTRGAIAYNHDNNSMTLRVDNAGLMTLKDSKVGIGTSTPVSALHIESANPNLNLIASSGNPFFRIGNATSGSRKELTFTYDMTSNYASIQAIEQGVATRNIAINPSGGNVGIGTTSPSAKLHIHSTSGDGIIRVTGDNIINSGGAIKGFNNGLAFNVAPNGGGSEIEAMRIQGSGNIGIGTTTPSYPLDIIGFANSSSGFRVTDGTIDNRISWSSGNVGFFGTVSNHPIAFNTNLTERMRITSAGNVGVNTTAPVGKLQVVDGDIRVTTSSSFSNLISSRAANPNAGGYNLGGLLFQAYSTMTSYTTGAAIYAYADGAAWTSSSVPSYLSFHTASSGSATTTEKMVIKENGNVGIGTTSPSNKLHVNSGTANEVAKFESTDGTAYLSIMDNNTTNSLQGIGSSGDNLTFYVNNAERMRIDSSGRVGIGTTTPSSLLHLESASSPSLQLTDTSQTTTLKLYAQDSNTHIANTTSHDMVFDTANTERMRITSSGNVGIGTTLPVNPLHVEGNFTLRGNQYMGDDEKLILGLGSDLQIYHNGSDSVIESDTGDLYITNKADGRDIFFRCDDGSGGYTTYFYLAGAGTNVNFQKDAIFVDDVKANFGNAGDLQIYHDGSNSYISDQGTGLLKILSNGVEIKNAGDTGYMAFFGSTGASELYYNGSRKLETTSDGVLVSGFLESKKSDTGAGYNDGIARFVNETTATSGGSAVINVRNTYGIGFGGLIKFWSTSTATSVGNISFNSSRTAVNYNTGSDYRLKEDYRDFNGLNIISDIDVYDFKWKNQDDRSYGVIAHELDQVVPGAVTGEKDAEDMQCVDYSKLVPVLIKSIQELEARLAALEN